MGKFSLGAQLFSVSRSTDVHKSMRVIEVKHDQNDQILFKGVIWWYQRDICLCIALKKMQIMLASD